MYILKFFLNMNYCHLLIYAIKFVSPTFIGGTLCPQQIHPNRAAARQHIGRNAQKEY